MNALIWKAYSVHPPRHPRDDAWRYAIIRTVSGSRMRGHKESDAECCTSRLALFLFSKEHIELHLEILAKPLGRL